MPERHGRWTIETLEVAEPGPQEVLVRVVASGICQTDVHARDGFFPIPCPAVYGHEGAGVVERVGRAVTTLQARGPCAHGEPIVRRLSGVSRGL